MIITYLTTSPDGGMTVKAKQVDCPFCGLLTVPITWGADEVYRWLEFTHLLVHVEELVNHQSVLPSCARCQRYAEQKMTPADPLHRACFSAECSCPCSYPAPPVDLTVRFEEAE